MKNQQESHLPPFRVRPRFEVTLPYSIELVNKKLRHGIKVDDACHGRMAQDFITLMIHNDDRHFWSPQLTLTMENIEGEERTLLRGMYGPAPAVWTMFVFFYSIIGLLLTFITIIGTSNYSMGEPSGILWWIPFLTVLLLSLYAVSYFGQKLGHDQMETLHQFVERSLGLEVIGEHTDIENTSAENLKIHTDESSR